MLFQRGDSISHSHEIINEDKLFKIAVFPDLLTNLRIFPTWNVDWIDAIVDNSSCNTNDSNLRIIFQLDVSKILLDTVFS
jgi:hypothetical protein